MTRKTLKIALSLSLMGACTITAMASDSTASQDTKVLPEYVVKAMHEKEAFSGGDVLKNSDLGLMGSTNTMDVPIQVTSFSNKVIKEYNYPGNTLSKVATLDPNVRNDGSSTYNDLRIRGFYVSPHDYYLDGVSGLLSQSSIPMNFVENVQVISGPATLLYGMSNLGTIGGAVNLVSKKAPEKDVRTIKETFSGKGNFETALDISHRFGPNKKWGLRTNIDYATGNTEFKHENMTRKNLFMNLDYQGEKDKANLLFGYRYVNQDGLNFYLDLNGNPLPAPPQGDSNFQLPWSKYQYNNHILAFNYEHNFNDNWTGFVRAGYQDEDWPWCFDSYYPMLIDNKGNFKDIMEQGTLNFWRLSITTGVRGIVKTKSATHNLAFSFDRLSNSRRLSDWDGDNKEYYGNIYNDSLSENNPTPSVTSLGKPYHTGAYIMKSFAFVDRVDFQNTPWTLLGGLRYQSVTGFANYQNGDYQTSVTKSHLSPNIGFMYSIRPNVKLYANYLEGLTEGEFVRKKYANYGEFLEPQKATQKELGVKWETGKLSGSASVFSIEQENAYADKNNIYGYHGHQRNNGAQFTVYGKVNQKVSLIGGMMYLTAKQHGGARDGINIPGVANFSAVMGVDYKLTPEWTLNGRINYTGAAYLNYANNAKVPSWYRLDIGATYTKQLANGHNLNWQMNVYNVLNRKYWIGRNSDTVYLDGGRNIVVSASYSF